MMDPKLILVEGIPGSGKTTTARFVADWLARQRRRPRLYLEGDLEHPADFESVACLDQAAYASLGDQFPAQRDWLARQAVVKGDEYFYSYRLLEQTYGVQIPAGLFQALTRYEIYELPAAHYRRLILQRWTEFAGQAARGEGVFIFECCFLQNPLTMLLGRNDEPVGTVQGFILEIAESVRTLEPRLVYLQPGEVEQTLRQAAKARPPEWLDFVIRYHTRQGHGKALGWQGLEGLVKFYEMRQAVELALLPRLPWTTLLVRQADVESDRRQVAAFLAESFA
jgi:hypothetical protein